MTFEFMAVSEDPDDIVSVVWMPNGLPLFVADRDDVCDVVESIGFNIYYLLANHSVTTTNTPKGSKTSVTTTTTSSQMYKVVNNFIGRAVSKCAEALPENIINVKEEAVYNMPPIPLRLVDKLDEFFRLIDAKYGTESIVLLTFDPSKEGSDGWGILVPDQSNTSVHCNYDPTSIIEHKPEDVLIVGSVHSHPGMAAYASGTDHSDQADFDGIHITFGWQKSVNQGATQYHIEMQMAGTAYTLRPQDVFEQIEVTKEPDPEVIGWTEHVKKALPPQQSAAGVTSHTSAPTNPTTSGEAKPTDNSSLDTRTTTPGTKKTPRNQLSYDVLPDVWKNLGANVIVVAEVSPNQLGKHDCPNCGYTLLKHELDYGYCDWCSVPILSRERAETLSMDDILDDIAYWCYQFNYTLDSQVFLWITNHGTENTLMPLTQGTLRESLNDKSRPQPSSNSKYYADDTNADDEGLMSDDLSDRLLCCGISVDAMHDCMCDIQIHPDDMIDFDNYTSKVNMYAPQAICNSCEFYYDHRCPSYRDNLGLFLHDVATPAMDFADTIDGIDCNMYQPFNGEYLADSYSTYDID